MHIYATKIYKGESISLGSCIKLSVTKLSSVWHKAKSEQGLEYTAHISRREARPSFKKKKKKMGILDMILNPRECSVSFHCHYSQVHFGIELLNLLAFMDQADGSLSFNKGFKQ